MRALRLAVLLALVAACAGGDGEERVLAGQGTRWAAEAHDLYEQQEQGATGLFAGDGYTLAAERRGEHLCLRLHRWQPHHEDEVLRCDAPAYADAGDVDVTSQAWRAELPGDGRRFVFGFTHLDAETALLTTSGEEVELVSGMPFWMTRFFVAEAGPRDDVELRRGTEVLERVDAVAVEGGPCPYPPERVPDGSGGYVVEPREMSGWHPSLQEAAIEAAAPCFPAGAELSYREAPLGAEGDRPQVSDGEDCYQFGFSRVEDRWQVAGQVERCAPFGQTEPRTHAEERCIHILEEGGTIDDCQGAPEPEGG